LHGRAYKKGTGSPSFVTLYIYMKERVLGIWRSYKVFYFSGKVEQHNATTYVEISVDEQEAFTFLQAQNKQSANVFPQGQWHMELFKNHWYIYLQKKQAYEIITLENEDMVLLDIMKGEKIFFAKMPGWRRRIEPIVNEVKHIKQKTEIQDRQL
jgi:hypothetical protein